MRWERIDGHWHLMVEMDGSHGPQLKCVACDGTMPHFKRLADARAWVARVPAVDVDENSGARFNKYIGL